METTARTAIKGGEFLIRETEASDIFIPEEWSEEQLLIAETCRDFIDKEVMPLLDRIDAQEKGLMPSLLDKAAELGLLGISIPEEYGGFREEFFCSLLSAPPLSAGFFFSTSLSAHTRLGRIPLLYFCDAEQNKKKIPHLRYGG